MDEIRLNFHQQLDEVQRDLLRAAAIVTETITRGTQILLDLDLSGARELIADDDRLDDLTAEIEDRCYRILVLQQPVATDLRTVITAIRLTSEIERSGDLMVNVAKAARRLYGNEIPARLRGLLEAMAEEAVRLYRIAMDAFAERDAALAGALDDLDDRLDRIHKDYIQAILELHAHTDDVQMAVQLALVGRYYERIGDHAVNIGERVTFMVTGHLPEYPPHEASVPAEGSAAAADADVDVDSSEAGATPRDPDAQG